MPADEEIDGIEIAGAETPDNPLLPPTTDPAETCDAYAEVEYAGECVDEDAIYPNLIIEGDSCDAYAEVEYAGECVNADTVFPGLPIGSSVEEFDTSFGRLGCGTPSVFITSRCSGMMACRIDNSNILKIIWTRRLDEVSEAEVEIGLTGDATITCCECLAAIEPWCHEIHIWRDGEEVWVGPIQTIHYERERVIIRARDALAWLDVRIPQNDIDFQAGGTPGGPVELTDIALFVFSQAFISEPTTCEMTNIYSVPTGEEIEYFAEAFNQTSGEILADLAGISLNFTVLGRTIVLTGDSEALTPLILLNDEHIMGDVEVTKDGQLQGNRYYVHYDEDGGIPAASEAADKYCYTLIERIRDGSGLQVDTDAEQVAASYVAASAIAPRILEIPAGSKLSPDTPWTINQMVPGARVDVAVTKLCLQLTQSFTLIGVTVEYSDSDGEAVGIELSPINNVEVL